MDKSVEHGQAVYDARVGASGPRGRRQAKTSLLARVLRTRRRVGRQAAHKDLFAARPLLVVLWDAGLGVDLPELDWVVGWFLIRIEAFAMHGGCPHGF